MYCAQCGTQNPAKATTCSQCGAALRAAPGPGTPGGRRCPMCSTVNAADAVYCVQCGARVQLLADADIPMPRSSFDDDYARDTNWFDTPTPDAGGTPGRLEGGRGDTAPAPQPPASGAGWLGSLRGEVAAPPPPPTSGGGWLSSLRGGDEDTAPPPAPAPPASLPPPPPPAASGSGGSWLDSLRDASVSETPEADEPPAAEASALPAWLQDTTPAAPAPPPAPAASSDPALPAWLSDSLAAAPGSSESTPDAPALPAWLSDEPTTPTPPTPELPAWLAGLRTSVDDEEEAEAAAPPEPEPAGDTSGLPAWLQDLHAAGSNPPATATPPAPGRPAWLHSLAPEEAPAPAPASDAIPPWLQDVTPPTFPDAAPAAPASTAPAWLAGLTDEPDAPPAAPATSEEPESAPWWAGLSGTEGPDTVGQASSANVSLNDEIELPAWLQAAAMAPPSTPTPVPTTGGWGAEAEAEPPAPVDAESVPAASLPAEADAGLVLPSWMDDEAAPPAVVPAEPPAAELPAAELPAAEEPTPAPAEPPAAAPAEPPTPGPEAAPVPTEPLRPRPGNNSGILFPAWLNELSTAPEADATAAAAPGESQLVGEEDLPAWLRALQPETQPPPAPAPVPPIGPMPTPATAAEQLPEWLQALNVSTPVEEEAPVEEVATIADALRTATPARVVRARPPRAGAVETFTRLLNPPAPVVTPRPVKTRQQRVMAWLFPDRLVYAVLLLTVIAMWAILRSPTIAPNPALTAPTDEARAFHALIAPTGVITPGRSGGSPGVLAAPLPLGGVAQQPVTGTITSTAVLSPALVVFDWDASRYGEMHELSRAVTRDLLTSGRPFVSVSLLPQGPGFADQVVNEVGSDPEFNTDLLSLPKDGGQYGSRYINLGWRPGNEAAIHALVSDPNGVLNARGTGLNYDYRYQFPLNDDRLPLTQKNPTLSQYGVVILLVSDESNLRLWMEQLATQTTVPVVAAVPMGLRAGVAPYLDKALAGLTTARLRGAVFGVQGASQLEQLRLGTRLISSAEQIRQGRWLHTESVALLITAALLLLGFFAGIYRWANRPRQ